MRVLAIVTRIIKQFARDKRTLALMIFAPLLILSLMYLVFAYDDFEPRLITNNIPTAVGDKLEDKGAVVIVDPTEINNSQPEAIQALLEEHNADAYIRFHDRELSMTLEGSDPMINKTVLLLVQQAMSGSANAAGLSLDISYIYGSEGMTLFDSIGPVLIGLFIFFFVFLISGVSFLRERTTGTLQRLLATPLRRWEIVLGYIIGFGLFTTFQTTLISWYAISVLGIMMEGTFLYVLLITFLLALTALTLGTLLSAFANNEFQMIQFIPLVIVPQVFFCGLFNLETMPVWLSSISYIMPLYYGAEALQEIMIRGKGFESIFKNIFILLSFSTVFCILNIQALKKHRKL